MGRLPAPQLFPRKSGLLLLVLLFLCQIRVDAQGWIDITPPTLDWIHRVQSFDLFLATNQNNTLFVGKGSSVYRSWNDGATWHAGDTIGTVGPIATHENGLLFAGTDENGVFASTDEGTTWIPFTGGLPDDAIRSLAVTPAGIVFVGTWVNGLYRSKDAIAVR